MSNAQLLIAAIRNISCMALNDASLLVSEWLPDGKRHKNDWIAKNPVRGDRHAGSFSVSLVTGKWHDFADNTAKGGDLVGLYAYLKSCTQLQAAQAIDSRLGLGILVKSTHVQRTSKAKQEASIQAAQARKQKEQIMEEHDRQAAKEQAKSQWQHAKLANAQHPYLVNKGVFAHGLRQNKFGALLVPVCYERELVNLQCIDPQGKKRFLSGGQVKGCYSPIGKIEAGKPLYICEGWATGATLYQQTTSAIACALNASNLKEVALAFRARYGESLEIIIAGDDDRKNANNTGKKAANDAALAVGALAIFPEWPSHAPIELSDFNDLAVWQMQQEASA
ncbi:MAG: toprim domain-containing protein [Moraxellaceae bacterium]|nr:toprim domain-containing protein [Moraxellaceae bacterium]